MQHWFYHDDHEQHGPLTPKQMRLAARDGRLRPHHQVSQDKKKWFDAKRVKGLFKSSKDHSSSLPNANLTNSLDSAGPSESGIDLHAEAAKGGSVEPNEQRDITSGSSVSDGSATASGGSNVLDCEPGQQSNRSPAVRIEATEQWDIASGSSVSDGSAIDLHDNEASGSATDNANQVPPARVEATERWDINSGSSATGGDAVGSPSAGASNKDDDISDGGDIFDDSSDALDEAPRPGATMIVRGLSPGQRLGNYEVLETLGQGGMGTVLKARHTRMDRLVALKILRSRSTQDAGAIERFQKEVRAASKLSHSNIVTAHDADEVRGVHFLVMEFVDGCDLEELLAQRKRLPHAEATSYILQAAHGLAFAHTERVIHRDIKPANLMLDKRRVIKILDMGLASVKQDATDRAKREVSVHLTQADQLLGTFDYMAPEQAVDARKADHRADIYSLGCTLYKLVTGVPPYRAVTTMEKILAHREEPIPMMSTTCSDVPFDLDAVFGKMVAKDVDDRYQTMAEVVKDLEACLKSQPIAAWQTGGWSPAVQGDGPANLGDEGLCIEPPKHDSADVLDEYTLSPVDDRPASSLSGFGSQDTSDSGKHDTKDIVPRWFWRVMGEEVGPLTLRQLKKRNVSTLDEVRREGTDEWIVAQDVEGLVD